MPSNEASAVRAPWLSVCAAALASTLTSSPGYSQDGYYGYPSESAQLLAAPAAGYAAGQEVWQGNHSAAAHAAAQPAMPVIDTSVHAPQNYHTAAAQPQYDHTTAANFYSYEAATANYSHHAAAAASTHGNYATAAANYYNQHAAAAPNYYAAHASHSAPAWQVWKRHRRNGHAPRQSRTRSGASAPGQSIGITQTGKASWYGGGFHGKRTANGERYDMETLTAAHRTLPFGTRVKVTNLENGSECVVRINNRGPFLKGRIIDLSKAAARQLGMINRGVAPVQMQVLSAGN